MVDITLDDIEKSGVLTKDQFKLLRNMHQGDRSNKKGETYERFFAFSKVLSLTKEVFDKKGREIGNLSHIKLSNTQAAFVDDLTVIHNHNDEKPYKENYQLKNSKSTGRINQEIIHKFECQSQLDRVFFREGSARSFLVCSCKDTVEKNNTNHNEFKTIFYPYCADEQSLIEEPESEVSRLLEEFCSTPKNYLPALKLVTSALYNAVEIRDVSLEYVWNEAVRNADPNIFCLESLPLPDWFVDKCKSMGLKLESNKHGEYSEINYFGMSFYITDEFIENLSLQDKDKVIATTEIEPFIGLILELNTAGHHSERLRNE